MCRRLSIRIAMLVLVASFSAPVFAAPRRDDSPISGIEQMIARMVKQIKKVFDLPVLQLPPG